MTARDAAHAALDSAVDGITTDAQTADELFAVVDLLDGQPTLRRSLSDPSASDAFIKLGTGLILAFVVIQFCRLVF